MDEVNGGHLGCQFDKAVSHDTALLLDNLFWILKDIEGSYSKILKFKCKKII